MDGWRYKVGERLGALERDVATVGEKGDAAASPCC